MKILHVLDHSIPLHSGYTFRTRAILTQQHRRGWETAHLTSPKHNAPAGVDGGEEDSDGLHFYRSRTPTGLLARITPLDQWAVVQATLARLREVIPSERPDILHAHSPALNGLAALRAGREFGLPVVYEIRAFWEDAAVDHGTSREGDLRYRLTRRLETHVVRRADAVTTICEGLRNDLFARGVAAGKITVIPNAVDIERFEFDLPRDAELAAELGLENKIVLGFIGSFYAYEGLALLLEALPGLLRVRSDIRLLLVGGGPQAERLRARAAELGIDQQVVFVGRVPHDQVHHYYGLVDAFVYPRLPMRLTELVTPLKPLEAMAQGKLVVASDVGGHRELIEDGVTGQLFRAGDPQALTGAVLALLDDRGNWPQRRAAGRRFVEQERNWAASVARYQTVYERLLQGAAE
ncbi:TIGR04063 family PEP-CTERM/XrtA system glycosyltransferase [Thiohalobacter thiocyanaticus]|uniref:Glycosyltransferase, exosortase A system-associated n=1 Tax=Thiohalobacter thiocyanaticus TaxID=585455 RepID=A0A426QM35_9GAMM|nr:TIGR04063 family PEP-CTERM/XrtA system glycosyltransferase [Thiohalobacter thiocyanaticus]RRQ22832.1 glycosyltransferase, exosortase A system-associated [Thiohalobacter thiocyanaticus]